MLKTVVLHNIFIKTMIFVFQDSLMNKVFIKTKNKQL